MDITPLIRADAQVIQSYKDGVFKVSGTVYNTPVLIFPDDVLAWHVSAPDALVIDDFKPLIDRTDAVRTILLGCGERGIFIAPDLRAALKKHGITIDAMDTGAACRTYNVLMAEGRLVVAALFPIQA